LPTFPRQSRCTSTCARTSARLVPLGYPVCAAAAFLAASLGAAWFGPDLAGHYYHPRPLALTHTVTLGWVTLAIMRASYQLIPIVLERPVWSERLALWQLAFDRVAVMSFVVRARRTASRSIPLIRMP
jgi:hypothetical protein